MKFQDYLVEHNACAEAREWVGRKSLATAWKQCKRPDWMIWVIVVAKLIDDKKLRHLAADFAEEVLPIFERERPNDDRPRKAIQAARDFADGKIGATARAAAGGAARDAAWAAAWDASRAAARVAARDAVRGGAAWAAAWDASRAAARVAARDAVRGGAVWAVAWDAAREKQCDRIRKVLKNPKIKGVK